MQIYIEYDSIWQNSFLSGDDNKPITKENKRVFKATSKSNDHIVKKINKNTIMGVLCRLIGYQGKLYQVREYKDYYFKGMDDLISFSEPEKPQTTEEIAFIVNKSDKRPPQSTFIGVIPDDTALFFSKSAQSLWAVLYLRIGELLEYIMNESIIDRTSSSMPRDLLFRIDEISNAKTGIGAPIKSIEKEVSELSEMINRMSSILAKQIEELKTKESPSEKQKTAFNNKIKKQVDQIDLIQDKITMISSSEKRLKFDKQLLTVIAFLENKYPDKTYMENGIVYPIRLYAAALYLQAERMISNGLLMDYCLNQKGEISIQGFSKRGFNGVRDFLNPLAGSKRKTIGTPFPLIKSSGKLLIVIDVNRDKAKEIKEMIENVGISSFYLGKKGLAYVTNIDTREQKQ